MIKRVIKLNISQIETGTIPLIFSTALFSYVGISFALHRKILDLAKSKVKQQNMLEKSIYMMARTLNNRMEGNYKSHQFDAGFIEEALKSGEFKNTTYYLIFSFFIESGQGKFEQAQEIIEKLREMGKIFDNNFQNLWATIAESKLLTKKRVLHEAHVKIDEFIDYSKKVADNAHLMWGYFSKAYIQYLMDEIPGAEQSMQKANQFEHKQGLYVFETTFMLSEFLIQLYYLEMSKVNTNDIEFNKRKKIINTLSKKAKHIAQKIADDRVEILKCIGTYYWLINRQKQSLKWWRKAISEGEQLNARPELGRLYLEAGKRMIKEKDKDLKLNGLTSTQCLEKAHEIFSELGLEQDIKDLHDFRLVSI